jgi:hypothetical protein
MEHTDADRLALIALGEAVPSDEEAAHLDSCPRCTREVRELSNVVHRARSAEGESLVDPSPAVWERIRDEIAETSQLAPGAGRTSPSASSHVAGGRTRRRWRTRAVVPLAVAALVVGLVAGTGVGVWWQSAQGPSAGIAVAGAELDPFPDWQASRGSAVVKVLADGTRQVVVDVETAGEPGPADAPQREVWLISADGTSLVSIGFLDGAEGTFELPPGVDIADYPLVDVSAEPDDGVETHSGNSIVRGELRTI